MDYDFNVVVGENGLPKLVRVKMDVLDKLAGLVERLPGTELATDKFQEYYVRLTAGFLGDWRLVTLDQKLTAKVTPVIPLILQKQDEIYAQAELAALDGATVIQKEGQKEIIEIDYSASKEKIVGLKLKRVVSSDEYRQLRPEEQKKYLARAKAHFESPEPRRLVFEAIRQDLVGFTRTYSLILEEGEINPFKDGSSREFWDQHWGTGKVLSGLVARLESLYQKGEEKIRREALSKK